MKTSHSFSAKINGFDNVNNIVTSDYFYPGACLWKMPFWTPEKAAKFGGKFGSHFMELFSRRTDVL